MNFQGNYFERSQLSYTLCYSSEGHVEALDLSLLSFSLFVSVCFQKFCDIRYICSSISFCPSKYSFPVPSHPHGYQTTSWASFFFHLFLHLQTLLSISNTLPSVISLYNFYQQTPTTTYLHQIRANFCLMSLFEIFILFIDFSLDCKSRHYCAQNHNYCPCFNLKYFGSYFVCYGCFPSYYSFSMEFYQLFTQA